MIVYTAIQPTGNLTIGNYIGSIKNFQNSIKDADEAYITVADLHSITVGQDPEQLKANIKDLLCLFFALDLHKQATIFVQSEVSAHAQLCWLLMTKTKMGELERMTQYKDKSADKERLAGLFTYPVLMASDILLYNTTHVPVGMDQKQHLELARNLAQRVNNEYGQELFVVPEPLIKEHGAKIYSLTDPSKKMSKSDENPKSFISLGDDEQTIIKKIKSATTDSLGEVNFDPENQPGVSNLLTIYASLREQKPADVVGQFKDQNYGYLKQEVAQELVAELIPIQEKVNYYKENYHLIEEYLQRVNQKLNQQTQQKLNQINRVFGLGGNND